MSQLKLAAALLSASLAAPVLTGCATTAGSGNPFGQQNGQQADAQKTQPVLVVNDKDCTEKLNRSEMGAAFDKIKNKFSGSSGCIFVKAEYMGTLPQNRTIPNAALASKRGKIEPTKPNTPALPAAGTIEPCVTAHAATLNGCSSGAWDGTKRVFGGIAGTIGGAAANQAIRSVPGGGVVGNVARGTATHEVNGAIRHGTTQSRQQPMDDCARSKNELYQAVVTTMFNQRVELANKAGVPLANVMITNAASDMGEGMIDLRAPLQRANTMKTADDVTPQGRQPIVR